MFFPAKILIFLRHLKKRFSQNFAKDSVQQILPLAPNVFLFIKAACCAARAVLHFGMLKAALAEVAAFSCGRGKISMRMEILADAHATSARCARSICRMRIEILLRADRFASSQTLNIIYNHCPRIIHNLLIPFVRRK
jgi:hypothetical protein